MAPGLRALRAKVRQVRLSTGAQVAWLAADSFYVREQRRDEPRTADRPTLHGGLHWDGANAGDYRADPAGTGGRHHLLHAQLPRRPAGIATDARATTARARGR